LHRAISVKVFASKTTTNGASFCLKFTTGAKTTPSSSSVPSGFGTKTGSAAI
jgi:hypothetical protein